MKLFRLFLAVILLILPITVYSASIGLIKELSFTIPELQGEILDIDFNDINGDNIPEVLACDNNIWVIYSITDDSVIFSDSIVFLPGSNINTKILFSDVNNDSIKDIAIARHYIVLSTQPIDSTVNLIIYDGSSGYLQTSLRYFSSGNSLWNCSGRGIGVLESIDIDRDNLTELIFSFGKVGASQCCQSAYGLTYIFNSFPDSFVTTNQYVQNLTPMNYQTDSVVQVVEKSRCFFIQTGDDIETTNQDIGYIDSIGDFWEWEIDNSAVTCTLQQDPFDIVLGEIIGCSGDISFDGSPSDLIILKGSYVRCNDELVHSSYDLILYEVHSSDSITELWTVESIQGRWTNFVYLPQFPGFFCAFVDDVFTQFNGSDGSVFQVTSDVPTGKREWDYPFKDSIPRLIVKNGNSISFYIADISTPVYEDDPPALPADFRLSQPYPNPFNPQVNLSLFIPRKSDIIVMVFNIVGQQIGVLYNGFASAGELKLQWNAKDNPSGIYLIKATSGKQSSTVKAVLLK